MNMIEELHRRFALQCEYGGNDKVVNRLSPLVSVSVVTYQHAGFIRQCLDGILMQETDFDYEIVVGEDESMDGTRDICIRYAEEHPDKIRLFLRDRTLSQLVDENGAFVCRFNGWWSRMSCRGRFIAVCEGDDYWTDPSKMQKQVECLERNPESVLCFHPVKILRDGELVEDFITTPPEACVTTIMHLTRRNYMHTPSVMFRNLVHAEDYECLLRLPVGDWPLWLKLARYGNIRVLPDCMAVYRIHPNALWSGRSAEEKNAAIEECIRQMLPDFHDAVRAGLLQHYEVLTWALAESALCGGRVDDSLRYLTHLCELVPTSVAERYRQLHSTERMLRQSQSYRFGKAIKELVNALYRRSRSGEHG